MEDQMEISERQLTTMTRDLDQMHRDLFPTFTAHLADICDEARGQLLRIASLTRRQSSRRSFLRGGAVTVGALGGGALITACGGTGTTGASASPSAVGSTDLQVARLAASLEILAVNTYASALKATGPGQPLAGAPPALGQFVTTAQAQHNDHGQAWNATLTSAGQAAQRDPDPKLNGMVQQQFGQAKNVTDVVNLALVLENTALQTYLAGAGLVTSKVAKLQAMTIAPVEAQHAAILNFVLGQYPVPDTFIPSSLARTPADLA